MEKVYIQPSLVTERLTSAAKGLVTSCSPLTISQARLVEMVGIDESVGYASGIAVDADYIGVAGAGGTT